MKVNKKFALVLSGGGVKGAWEAGFLKYVAENWGHKFHTVSGTSIGALIGLVYSAAAHDEKNLPEAIVKPWNEITLSKVAKIPWSDLFHLRFYSVLDNSPLLDFVNSNLDLEQYRKNIDTGIITTNVMVTTELTSKRLHMWVDSKDNKSYDSPAWITKKQELNGTHAVASGAVPIAFRSQQLDDGGWHVDGGLCENTPIAPILMSFYDDRSDEPDTSNDPKVKILVLTLPEPDVQQEWTREPTILTQTSRMFESLTVNQIMQDVAKAKAINDFLDTLGVESYGKYRKLDLLVVRPSESLDALAGTVQKEIAWGLFPTNWISSLSFLLIFQPYVQVLLKKGYEDAVKMHDQLEEFFNS
jgi:NTE family protein